MSSARRLALCAGLVCVLLAGSAVSAAGVTTIYAYPGGEASASSSEVTFSSSLASIVCPLTLQGTLATEATGTLTASPEPASNPRIGTFARSSVGTCRNGTVRFLSPTELRWPVYVYAREGTRASVMIQGVALLFEVSGLARCLVRANMRATYDSSTGNITIGSLEGVTVTNLGGIFCPTAAEMAVAGTLAAAPRQILYEAADERLECRAERGEVVVEFETVNPGGISTRTVTCKNISLNAAVLRVVAGSRIEGAFAARFREIGVPAVGEVLFVNDTRQFMLRFAPEAEAERRTSWGASFKFAFRGASFFVNMRGATT